jgi:glycosyltransferase involved in cell wall biosynthesis
MLLSVIVPVFNEKNTILEVVKKIQAISLEKEIIIVDDCSTDGTREILQKLKGKEIRVFFHSRNRGKGAALRTAFKEVKGEIVIIQDADLEYEPEDYPVLIKPIIKGFADVVYGSRFLGPHRVFTIHHYLGNKFLTWLTNILYNTILTDMETGAKAFRREVIESFELKADRFNIEPEITAKVLRKRFKLYEVPISYYRRDYAEGKKITWKDGLWAIGAILKYRFFK